MENSLQKHLFIENAIAVQGEVVEYQVSFNGGAFLWREGFRVRYGFSFSSISQTFCVSTHKNAHSQQQPDVRIVYMFACLSLLVLFLCVVLSRTASVVQNGSTLKLLMPISLKTLSVRLLVWTAIFANAKQTHLSFEKCFVWSFLSFALLSQQVFLWFPGQMEVAEGNWISLTQPCTPAEC